MGAFQDFRPSTTEYDRNGASVFVRLGGMNETYASYGNADGNGGMNLLTFRRQSDGDSSYEWGFTGEDINFSKLGEPPYWQMTTRSTTKTFGRTYKQPHKLVLFQPIFQDPGDANTGRVLGVLSSVPSAPSFNHAGPHARGDRYFNINASPGGFEGWVCTTAGAIHNSVWVSGLVIDGNTIVKNSANRVYRLTGQATSTTTVEPVHTSGAVLDAQGNTWTWLGDDVPVFKEFGAIAA